MKKRILFLSLSKSWGGLEMNLVRYASWMNDRGHEVVVLSFGGSSVFKRAQELGLKCLAHDIDKSGYLCSARKLKPLIKAVNPEVLWFREKEIQKMLPFLKSGQKFQSLYQQGMQLGKAKKDLIHRWLYRSIDHWLAPNRFMYEQAKTYTSLTEAQLSLVPLAMDIAGFTSLKKEKNEARKLLDLPLDKQIIGVIGRIDPQKNQKVVLEAFAKIQDQHEEVHLLIMGDNTYAEGDAYERDLRKFVSQNRLESKVHFRSYRKEVELFYSSVDMMVVPSLNESFGRVTLEGMTYGLPMIGANTGGTAELIGNEEFLFPPEDAEKCAQLLDGLLCNIEARTQLGRAMESTSLSYGHAEILSKIETLLR